MTARVGSRRGRGATSLPAMWTELMLAAPQVVAHRVTRMALAGPVPSGRDRREFSLMVAEKNAAFARSWQAMGSELATLGLRSWFAFASGRPAPVLKAWSGAGASVLSRGLAPVHRTAVANARRLAGSPLR